MIIVNMTGGLGNQLFQYAAGQNLARKYNTELKLDLKFYRDYSYVKYLLPMFNARAEIASQEEISQLKTLSPNNQFGRERGSQIFTAEFFSYPDNIYLNGCWESERYFADVADIVRQEFTLKNPLGETAQGWKEKILNSECSVSVHIRHGDFAYNPMIAADKVLFAILPLDYYYECINRLKQNYPNLNLFVFSNNLQWCKENFRAGVPTEFVEGENLQDFEELHLMSLCKHNIIANSTYSWWGAWLNQNPDKKVFVPIPSFYFGTNQHYRFFLPERNENSPFDSDRWIRIPFDVNAQPSITSGRPYFSILLVVNGNIKNFDKYLAAILNQSYKFYEVILVDNVSTNGSGKICREITKVQDNVTLIKLHDKVQNGAAWNIALKVAQGDYVMFLKDGDRIFSNALSSLYLSNGRIEADIANSIIWLKEDKNGNIDISGEKFIAKSFSAFQNMNGIFREKLDKLTLLKIFSNDETFPPLQTRIFKRKFLAENKIAFNEKLGDEAEQLFTLEAMFQTAEIIFISQPHYVAPLD